MPDDIIFISRVTEESLTEMENTNLIHGRACRWHWHTVSGDT